MGSGKHCEETLRAIELFLDGELEPGRCAEIERHLSGCDPCMQRAEFRRHLKIVIASKCGCREIPQALRERVTNLLRDLDPSA